MAISPNLLNALAASAVTSLSDADAATALSVPTYTPLADPITYRTLCDAWGTVRAYAVMKELTALSTDTTQTADTQAAAYSAVITLNGIGFLMSSSETVAAMTAFVSSGLITQDEANEATCSVAYQLGAPVATADVTSARAVLSQYQSLVALQTQVPQFFGWAMNEQLATLMQSTLAGTVAAVPAISDLLTQFLAGGNNL